MILVLSFGNVTISILGETFRYEKILLKNSFIKILRKFSSWVLLLSTFLSGVCGHLSSFVLFGFLSNYKPELTSGVSVGLRK